jgi:uncharacterized Fe-S center protein
MKSKVYFIDLRTSFKDNLLVKIGRLVETAGLKEVISERDLTAVKLHFGEYGNTAFIRPVFIRKIVEMVKKAGGNPFLTDANTLYAGTRSDAASHLKTAIQNGFDYAVVEAPIVIADGLRGKSEITVPINRKRFQEVYIASEIHHADALVSVAHFKGHELAGFGGTLKNLGMGCASRRGKMAQHSDLSPEVKKKRCIGCGDCLLRCSQQAISLVDKKATIDPKKCIGCGECILICPRGTIQIQWSASVPVFLEAMMEYAEGALKNKKGKSLFINFLTGISPACDCMPYNDAPIVRDIGIMASTDPVAIDRASIDMVNGEPGLSHTCLETNKGPGEDKFKAIYPHVEWTHQFEYAKQLGLGTDDYDLEKI